MYKKFLSKSDTPKHKKNQNEFILINDKTPFDIREAYKALYTNILYLNTPGKCKKIAITSSIPSESKTTLSTNLAVTIAANAEGKKVLLIDADMRQPKVTRLLSLDIRGRGLSEYLAGIDEKPNLNYIPKLNLTVLTSGGPNVNPTMLIGSSKMSELIKICEQEFDYIIIDTPPVNVVTDALLLNDVVDGYIISVLADYSNVNYVSQCVESLNRIGATVYGMVISAVKSTTKKSGYSKYSKYASRYSRYLR